MKKIFFLIICSFFFNVSFSQNIPPEEILKEVKDKINFFNSCISYVADKKNSREDRNSMIESAVGLFESENNIMYILNLKDEKPKKIRIKTYFEHLRDLPYDRVEISFPEVKYEQFELNPDANYVGTYSYTQIFRSYKDGKKAYSDIVQKDVEINVYAPKGDKDNWNIKLGDINVNSVEKIENE